MLAITGDTPATVRVKWKRKVQPSTATAVPSEADTTDWLKWAEQNRTRIEAAMEMTPGNGEGSLAPAAAV